MASSIMHLAIAAQLFGKIKIADRNRFYIGSILPDAAVISTEKPSNSHFRRKIQNQTKSTMDTEAFFIKFAEYLPYDGLYLGYYFHLIEDVIFRRVLYYDLNLIWLRGEQLAQELHTDYWNLNSYLVKKYDLSDDLYIPEKLQKECLLSIADFNLDGFLKNCSPQFHTESVAKTKHFSNRDADSYIARCTELCLTEYKALKRGNVMFHPEHYAWDTR